MSFEIKEGRLVKDTVLQNGDGYFRLVHEVDVERNVTTPTKR